MKKITELFMAHGYEGLGLFYTILERLAFQEQPIKTDVLKTQLKIGQKTWKTVKVYGKFGHTFIKQW